MVQYILVRQTVTYKEALEAGMKYEGVSTTALKPLKTTAAQSPRLHVPNAFASARIGYIRRTPITNPMLLSKRKLLQMQ